jgi:DNA polymerase (family 10)
VTNAELAGKLRDLHDFLVAAGYEEGHATRYLHIARYIERMQEPAERMRREGRLTEIPQVGKLISSYLKEIIDTGVCSKQRDWEENAPFTIVEMCRVPGIGPHTARMLFEIYEIKSLSELKEAVRSGRMDQVLSQKNREAIIEAPSL